MKARAAQQQGGQPQAAPQQAPQGEEPFSLGDHFDQNPFEGILNKQQAAPAPEAGQGAMQGQEIDPQAVEQYQQMQDPKHNPLLPGANPGGSKFLVGAIQQLQGYIGESTERDEIAIARAVIRLLTKLIDKDQETQDEKVGGGEPQQPEGGAY